MTEQTVMRKQGRLVSDMRAEHQEWLDEQPTSTSCFFCDWTTDGTAAECREAARAHREKEHPEAANRLGRRRAQSKPKHQRTDAENEHAGREAAEARRVRADREDAALVAKVEAARQRDALAAMDAGLPQDREEEPPGPHLEAEEPEPQPANSPPPRDKSTPDEGTTMHVTVAERLGLKKFGSGYIWTRQGMLEAVRVYATEHGEPPNQEDSKRARLGMLPSTKSVGAEFADWDALIVAAGYAPRAKGSGLASGKESGRPSPPTGAAPAQAEESASSPEHEPKRSDTESAEHNEEPRGSAIAVVATPSPLRDPIRTADIPYDAAILEDEADFLRQRAAALDQIAAGVRALAAASRVDPDEEEALAA